MSDYNYTKFSGEHYNLLDFKGPLPGTKAPDGIVNTMAGGTQNLLDCDAPFMVMEIGSITCPLFQSRRKGMRQISCEFPDLAYKILYVREAHPGQNIAAHRSIDKKRAQAKLLRDGDKERREIVIDGMDGAVHAAYGGFPNALYIINSNGCVVYQSPWNNPRSTRRAIKRLLAGKPVRSGGYFLPATPPVAAHTLRQAGKGAARDFFSSPPGLIRDNLFRYNLALLLRRDKGVDANISC